MRARAKRRKFEDIRASKPLLGFGWAGVALSLIAGALLYVWMKGYDANYYVLDGMGRAFGPGGIDWYMYRFLTPMWLTVDAPVYGPVALSYTLVALQLHPRRVGTFRVLLVVAWALASPGLLFAVRGHVLRLLGWPTSGLSVSIENVSLWTSLGVGVVTSLVLWCATRSWRVGAATSLAAPVGSLAWMSANSPGASLVAALAGHLCLAVPLFVWAIRARLRPALPDTACESCGYDLVGLAPGAICPECGVAMGGA